MVIWILANTDSGNGLLLNSTKLLPALCWLNINEALLHLAVGNSTGTITDIQDELFEIYMFGNIDTSALRQWANAHMSRMTHEWIDRVSLETNAKNLAKLSKAHYWFVIIWCPDWLHANYHAVIWYAPVTD